MLTNDEARMPAPHFRESLTDAYCRACWLFIIVPVWEG